MRLFVLFLALMLAGCGVRQISSPDGRVVTDLFIDYAAEPDCGDDQTTIVQETNVGLWVRPNTVGFGVRKARYACVPKRCQIVIWADDETVAGELRELFGTGENICVR